MIARVVVALGCFMLVLAAIGRPADACCLGCPCTKYKRQPPEVLVVQDPAFGYVHSVRGAVPSWSLARITKLLTTGIWRPLPPPKPAKGAVVRPAKPDVVATPQGTQQVRHVPPPEVRFLTADKANEPSELAAQPVLVRRIEKQGRLILVELDDRTFKLVACPSKPGFACLVDPGGATLQPIPPPGGGTTPTFAQPPPATRAP